MAFPTGWTKKHKISIDYTKVSGSANLTNFPVLLTAVNFLTDCFDYSDNGGGDLRFSSDSAGTTQLPCEVVKWDNGVTNTAEVWVKLSSISYTANTEFYVWYNNSGQTQPAHTDTYGTHNVWNSNYKGVWHLENNSYTDSTASGYDLTATNTPAQVAGKFGGGVEFDTANNEKIGILNASCANLNPKSTNGATASAWVKANTSDTYGYVLSKNNSSANAANIGIRENAGTWDGINYNTGAGAVLSGHSAQNNVWVRLDVVAIYNTSINLYVDKGIHTAAAGTNTATDDGDFFIGSCGSWTHANSYFAGVIDEVQWYDGVKTVDWITTEYNNQDSPSTFSTPSAISGDVEGLNIRIGERKGVEIN